MTSTLPPLIQAFSGALGSAVSNVGSYPLDLVSTRVLLSKRPSKGLADAHKIVNKTVQTQGVSGLYAGLESDTGATILSNFIYYYAYSLSRSSLVKRKSRQMQQIRGTPAKAVMLSVPEELLLGFLAGIISRIVTTPLSVVTVRLQSEQERDETDAFGDDEEDHEVAREPETGIVHVFRSIYKEQGLAGFWSGFQSTILLCLNPSFTLFFFQAFRRLVLRGKDRERPTPFQAFIGAAFSNAMAVLLLFPLILAKTRLQAKDPSGRRPPPSSILDVWQQAVRKQGVNGLYQGLEVQMLKGFLNQGLTMMVKQRLESIIVALYLRSR